MQSETIIRAWKDPAYRMSLTAEESRQIPAHPAGLLELGDADLDAVAGGCIVSDIGSWIKNAVSAVVSAYHKVFSHDEEPQASES